MANKPSSLLVRRNITSLSLLQPITDIIQVERTDNLISRSINEISRIIPLLYLGNCMNAHNCKILHIIPINAILNITLGEDTQCMHPEHNIDYHMISIPDLLFIDIGQYFDITFNFIESNISNGRAVYVHCMEGISRSPTIVIAYLMKKYNQTYENVLFHVKMKRICIEPNIGFIVHLKSYQKKLSLEDKISIPIPCL